MTFVAQPYEQFVDDLLTALTGGMVREEHQFIDTEESYSLASPNPILASIKVFGQRNEAFALFERDIDYAYDTEQESIVWMPDGKLPDSHTFFYVNYYVQEGQRRLTDRNPGSVTTTLAEAFSREFAVLHKQMELIYQSAFVDLATGASLDHVAALLGLTRKDARFANGEVLFTRSTPATGDITIPAGTLVSTISTASGSQNFETTDKRTLRKGQLSVTVPVRAQTEGPAGRVEAGAITIINRPIFGIEAVMNEAATFFATTKETDEEFRRRIKGTLERAGKATVDAIKYSLIDEIPEITEGNIQIIENARVPGLVEVKLGLESTGDADLVRRIEESIFSSRPAGVRVVHNLPTLSKSEGEQKAEAHQKPIFREEAVARFGNVGKPQAVKLGTEIHSQMPEGLMPLRVEVLLRLSENNLSPAQKEDIEDNVRNRVKEYIDALPMGADLVYNKLLCNIVQPEEISDAMLSIGTTLNNESYTTNLSTEGRKAQIGMNDVFVGLMEELVWIDIQVKLELEPKNKEELPSDIVKELKAAVREGGTIYKAIMGMIRQQLVQAKSELSKDRLQRSIVQDMQKGGSIHKAVMDIVYRQLVQAKDELTKDGIRNVTKIVEPRLQMVEDNPVSVNAEYEETGRTLVNTDEVVVDEHESLKVRKLVIELEDELNA